MHGSGAVQSDTIAVDHAEEVCLRKYWDSYCLMHVLFAYREVPQLLLDSLPSSCYMDELFEARRGRAGHY